VRQVRPPRRGRDAHRTLILLWFFDQGGLGTREGLARAIAAAGWAGTAAQRLEDYFIERGAEWRRHGDHLAGPTGANHLLHELAEKRLVSRADLRAAFQATAFRHRASWAAPLIEAAVNAARDPRWWNDAVDVWSPTDDLVLEAGPGQILVRPIGDDAAAEKLALEHFDWVFHRQVMNWSPARIGNKYVPGAKGRHARGNRSYGVRGVQMALDTLLRLLELPRERPGRPRNRA
jgi:hypothetical protein